MKKKTKRLYKVVLFAVMLSVLASMLSVFSSAFSWTDFTEWNYLDLSTLSATPSKNKDGDPIPFIQNVDNNSGTLVLSVPTAYTGTGGIPTQFTGVTLRDLCPEMVAGQRYILNVDFLNSNAFTNCSPSQSIKIGSSFWGFNTSRVITEEDLNAKVMFYSYNLASAGSSSHMQYDAIYKMWINKGDTRQAFMPSSVSSMIDIAKKEAYDKGYEDGYDIGYDTGKGNLGYLQKNTLYRAEYRQKDALGNVKYYDNSQTNGYRFYYPNSASFPSSMVFKLEYFEEDFYFPDGKDFMNEDSPTFNFTDVSITSDAILWWDFTLAEDYVPFAVEDFEVAYYNPRGETVVVFCCQLPDGKYFDIRQAPAPATKDGEFGFVKYDNSLPRVEEGTVIVGVRIHFYTDMNNIPYWDDASSGAHVIDENYISDECALYLIRTNNETYNEAYQIGYEFGEHDGYNSGYVSGHKDGLDYGYDVGYDKGYIKGNDVGYDKGYTEGNDVGYDKGYTKGNEIGYNIGYNSGYIEGSEQDSWYNMVFAVVDAPISVLTDMFDFSIFGVNLSGFVVSILTLCCVVAVMRFII